MALLLSSLHHGLALAGLGTFVLLLHGGVPGSPAIEPASTVPGETAAASEGPTDAPREAATADPHHGVLARYLSRRYRLAREPVEMLVAAAFRTGKQLGIDPLLLLAVMAVESRFNPIAESVMGARGLMQVIPKYHQQVVAQHGGVEAMLEPAVNILVGAQILKDYIQRTGSIEAGLQFYNGAPWDESSQYAQKVIAEKERLSQALSGQSGSSV
jgi:soluble lytic murein transglycosylase-like protein